MKNGIERSPAARLRPQALVAPHNVVAKIIESIGSPDPGTIEISLGDGRAVVRGASVGKREADHGGMVWCRA